MLRSTLSSSTVRAFRWQPIVHCRHIHHHVPPARNVTRLTRQSANVTPLSPYIPQYMSAGLKSDGPITWKSLLIGGSIMGALYGYSLYLKNEKDQRLELEKRRSFGKPAIGGSFELIDSQGKKRKSEEFLGRWVLMYFGFTHCPDVCPEELDKLATVIDNLPKTIDLVPLFISVDPERDTPEIVGKYLSEFSNKFIGLTGTKEQVERATRAYRVYYSVGPKDADNDYIVDHTIISYLVNPKGELVDYFGQTRTEKEIEATIKVAVNKYEKIKSE